MRPGALREWVFLVLATAMLSACKGQPGSEVTEVVTEEVKRPNILLIVADDMGYTDLGAYGGEVDTPHLDRLASSGLLLTDFHNKAVCTATRAALLSGTGNHKAGYAPEGQKRILKFFNDDVVIFPRLLADAGYNTSFAGKWHLGGESHRTPDALGFERSFTLIQGGASHWSDGKGMFTFQRKVRYVENGVPVEQLPEDFYSSHFYTDYIIKSIDADAGNDKPFFAFLSFTAPHWPLHAPDEYIAKYKGAYDQGYEVLREQRIAKGKEKGVIPANAVPYPRLQEVAPWDSLTDEEKQISTRKMEVYAGMIDAMDVNIGRLIDHLKAIGEYDNTFIVFLSDNGAEGGIREPGPADHPWVQGFDNSLGNIGKINSHTYTGPGWAQASSGVSRYFKLFTSEGGIRGPAIVHYSKMSKKGVISDAFISVEDLAPTFLELAETTHPERGYDGRLLEPINGVSMLPLVLGDADSIRPDDYTFGWERGGHFAIRQGDWKLLRLESRASSLDIRPIPIESADYWGLYNLAVDPGEVNDLSESEPQRVAALLEAWEAYVAKNDVPLEIFD